MKVSTVGSHVTLLFHSKYQTFTPAQLIATFQDQGFLQTKGNANISANPLAPPVPTTIFSKDNLVILFNQNENLIMFQIINTLDFNELYEKEIQKILISLNYNPSSVSLMGIDVLTQIHEVNSPIETLTSLVNKEFVNGLKINEDSIMKVSSIKLTNDSEKESLSLDLQPLQTDPNGSYVLAISYKTNENDKFNEFIKEFGEDMISKIIDEAQKYA